MLLHTLEQNVKEKCKHKRKLEKSPRRNIPDRQAHGWKGQGWRPHLIADGWRNETENLFEMQRDSLLHLGSVRPQVWAEIAPQLTTHTLPLYLPFFLIARGQLILSWDFSTNVGMSFLFLFSYNPLNLLTLLSILTIAGRRFPKETDILPCFSPSSGNN